ncbi:MAG: Lrp/AsnC family transcriptional regulator [Rhodobacteraceae bacterium]|nr:Lrp/AsnC family transcriptional regulator [Paracoccaceae bacterium]
MDDTDRELLAALRRDARASLSELSGALGISRATVRARIARMQERGDILGFTVRLKEDLSQTPVRGLMMLEIEGAGAERIRGRLTGWPEVRAVHSTNGKWDMIVEIGTDTLEEFDRVLTEIRRLDGVIASETNLLLSTRPGARARRV